MTQPIVIAEPVSRRGRLLQSLAADVVKVSVSDELWATIEPLLPPPKARRFRHPGWKRLSDRAALNGILIVMRMNIAWNRLGVGADHPSGISCWRRLREWQEEGVWERVLNALVNERRLAAALIAEHSPDFDAGSSLAESQKMERVL